MNTENLSFGQKIDEENGLVMPWLTHGALDFFKKINLSDKNILMYGAGLGDSWLSKMCKWLNIIERNNEWLFKSSIECANNNCLNVTYHNRPCNDCSGKEEYYCEIPFLFEPDVIIVDDAYRYECIIKAIEYSKQSKKESILLVVDNWQQDFVFICPAAEEALKDYYTLIFKQEDHKDHEGRPWQTAIFNLCK